MLQLAYWIGTVPGVVDESPDLDVYRDTRSWGRTGPEGPDQWVMFHFHFDENREIFLDNGLNNGHTQIGFVSSCHIRCLNIPQTHAHNAADSHDSLSRPTSYRFFGYAGSTGLGRRLEK